MWAWTAQPSSLRNSGPTSITNLSIRRTDPGSPTSASSPPLLPFSRSLSRRVSIEVFPLETESCPMLKVGVPDAVDPELHRLLPVGISLELIPLPPTRKVDVDFWIAPPWTNQAERQLPFLEGLRVIQATV